MLWLKWLLVPKDYTSRSLLTGYVTEATVSIVGLRFIYNMHGAHWSWTAAYPKSTLNSTLHLWLPLRYQVIGDLHSRSGESGCIIMRRRVFMFHVEIICANKNTDLGAHRWFVIFFFFTWFPIPKVLNYYFFQDIHNRGIYFL